MKTVVSKKTKPKKPTTRARDAELTFVQVSETTTGDAVSFSEGSGFKFVLSVEREELTGLSTCRSEGSLSI
jgi:hypothetical protein